MSNKTLFEIKDYVSFLEDTGANISVNENADSTTIERIKKLITLKKDLLSNNGFSFN